MTKWYGTLFGRQNASLQREFKSKFEDEMEELVEKYEEKAVFCDNAVVTSKYNVLTFLPRQVC